jgi:chorismate mutase / prephenate dehydrogenase
MPLTKVRKEIDKLDHQLLKLFKKRVKLVERVGIIKKKYGLPIFSKTRELDIDKKLDKFAKKHGLRKTFLQKIWKVMIDEAKVVQQKIK